MENQFVPPEDFLKRAGSIAWGWVTPLVQEKYPSFVIAPHFTARSGSPDVFSGWQSPGAIEAIYCIIEELVNTGLVDENRIYITGHSFGGGATWAYPLYLENYFAAILPTSYVRADPALDTEEAKKTLIEYPIWSAQHRYDGPLGSDHEFLESLKVPFIITDFYGDQEVSLTEDRILNFIDAHERYFHTEYGYPCGETGEIDCHFAMDSVVQDQLIHKWLFQQYSRSRKPLI